MSVQTPPRPSSSDALQALIEEARLRARRRRRRNVLLLAVAVLVIAGVAALAFRVTERLTRNGGRSNTSVPSASRFGAGSFWYMRAFTSLREWLPAGGITMDARGYMHRHGPGVLFDVRLTEETWVGTDGTMRDRVTATSRFASIAGRAAWSTYGRPQPNFNQWLARDAIVVAGGRFPAQLWYPWSGGLGPYGLDLGDSLFSYRELLALPKAPEPALSRITGAEEALMRREDRTATSVGYVTFPGGIDELTDIGGLLASPLPTATRLALLHAAMRLPGAKVNRHARDALGRVGIAVTSTAGIAMQRLIFQPVTGMLLQGPKGTVLAQGRVASAYALPTGTHRINVADEPAVPPVMSITPATGDASTIFTVTLTTRPRTRQAPRLDWILGGTAGQRCFPTRFQRPLISFARREQAGKATYLYRLHAPRSAGWCQGRYELQVTPEYSTRPWRPPLKAAGTPTFSAGAGSSTYFAVR